MNGEPDRQLLADTETSVQRLSAEVLCQLLDATSSVIGVKDLAGRYLYVNRAFVELMGGSESDYVGRSDADLFPPALSAKVTENDRQVLRECREIAFEDELTVHGEQRVYLSRKYPLLDTAGRAWALCLTAQDITESRRTDEALRQVALGISAATGPAVFELTVSSLARTLGVDLAFIAALEDTSPARLATLAICEHGKVGGHQRYLVAGTPCSRVIERGFRYYSDSAGQRFPEDVMLSEAGFVSYAGYPLISAGGDPLGILSICHSGSLPPASMVEACMRIFSVRVTGEVERMRIDRALAESEASYRTLFEASEDCIFIHDSDTGAILDVNPRACSLYGYDHDTLLAMTPGELSTGEAPYSQADAIRHIERAKAGEVVRFEWHRRNADGSTHWDEVCLKAVRLAGQDRILAVTRDITERMRREQALARSEDRLRATVEAALDSIISMDDAGKIREFNPAAERTFGHKRADVIGKSLAELIVPERHRQAHQQGMARYLQSGERRMLGQRVELTALRADGGEFPVELTVTEAEGVDGQIFIGYLRDITDRRKAEQAQLQLQAQLRQAQKMEAIGHVTGGIAHDFNNILTGIMGYLSMAMERADRLHDERMIGQLRRARHAGLRATELIQQMLTFSRGQRGRRRPLAPAALLRSALKLVRATLPTTISLDIETREDASCIVADPVQFEQVLMNLCINARDAMNGSGTLSISLSAASFAEGVCSSCQQALSGEFVVLEVADRGPGLDEASSARLFEPFYSTKTPGQGSGMGLATVHGIVHDHGGHILAGNRAAGGASFRVLWPLGAEPVGADGYAQAISADVSGRGILQGRVLLVEDDATVREFMSELLHDWGLTVSVFDDPLSALSALPARRHDLAILDYTMPHMTGPFCCTRDTRTVSMNRSQTKPGSWRSCPSPSTR